MRWTSTLNTNLILTMMALGALGIGLVFVSVNSFKQLTYVKQEDALKRVLDIQIEHIMQNTFEVTREFGINLQQGEDFQNALDRRDREVLSAYVNAQFQRYFVTIGLLKIQSIDLLDTQLKNIPVDHSRNLCQPVLNRAKQRTGAERFKILESYCFGDQQLLLSLLIPVGSIFKPVGYVHILVDPVLNLKALEATFQAPISVVGSDLNTLYQSSDWQSFVDSRQILIVSSSIDSATQAGALTIQLINDMHDFDTQLDALRNYIIFFAFIITLAVLAAVFYLLKRSTLGPLNRLTQRIRKFRGVQASPDEKITGFKAFVEGLVTCYEDLEKLSTALEATNDGLWDYNPQTGKTYFSPRWYTMLGYAPDAFPASISTMLALIHPDTREHVQKTLKEHFEAGDTFHYECRMRCHNGDYQWILNRGRTVDWDQGGKPKRVVGTHADISTLKDAQAAMKKAKMVAEAANQAKSTFLANMSHEIRTPMTAILGYAQLMQSDPQLADHHISALSTIDKAGNHLLELINDILDLSKIEANKTELMKEDFDLNDLLTAMVGIFEMRCSQQGLKWQLVTDLPGNTAVHADQGKLRQILINFLGNACKFTHQGEVGLSVSADADRYTFTVFDSGPGIAPEQLKTIFEPFQQADQGKQKGGTGLGLAISKNYITLMDGALEVQSEVGKGATFTFHLTLEPAQEMLARNDRSERIMALLPGQQVSALAVEDDEDILALMVACLKRVGVSTRAAKSGAAAMAAIQAEIPDIVFTDIQMPEMSGFQLLHEIRQTYADSHVYCVALSASSLIHRFNNDDFLQEGFDAYISKPFRFESVYQVLSRLLGVTFVSETIPEPHASYLEDVSHFVIPQQIHAKMTKAAEFGMIFELEEHLKQFNVDNPDCAPLVQAIEYHLQNYNTDKVVELLKQVRVAT